MKTKACRGSVLVGLVLCVLLTGICSVVQAKTHSSNRYGYSIIVPDDWNQVPNNIVQSSTNALFTKEWMRFDTIFQISDKDKLINYPSVGVSVVEYSDLGAKRSPTKAEMEKVVKGIIQANNPSKVNEFVTKEAQQAINDYRISDISFNNKNAYRFVTTTKIKDVGVIQGETVGHFGKYAVVQVSFYNKATDWQHTEHLKDSILNSFKFDSYHDYKPPSMADRIGHMPVKNILFIIVGLVVCLNAIRQIVKAAKDKQEPKSKMDYYNPRQNVILPEHEDEVTFHETALHRLTNCPNCLTEGILPMSDGRCPNCKKMI